LEVLNLSRTFYEEGTLIGFANLFNGKNRTLRKLVLKGKKEQNKTKTKTKQKQNKIK